MSNLNKFEAFKLEKRQMNAIAGGRILCTVEYDGDEFYLTPDPSLDIWEVGRSISKSYGHWADRVGCVEV